MIDRAKLRALVAERLRERHEWEESCASGDDYRSLSAAPYAEYGSPMGKYRAMGRLLSDADEKFLALPFVAAMKFRRDRRKIFRGYVADLRKEADALLTAQAVSASADRHQTQRDRDAIQSALRRLEIAAWMHCFYLPGVLDRVADALRDVNGALGLGQLVQMSAPQTL